MKKRILNLLPFILLANPCLASVRYVNAAATGTNNGNTWTNAYTDLQSALGVAVAGDSVWVAAGTYKPTTVYPFFQGYAFNIPTGVTLLGGFAGTETSASQRNITVNTTTLSGTISGTAGYGSWHIVTMNNADAQTRLDGFTVTGGYAVGTSTGQNEGAGLYISGNSYNPVVANCIFSNNHANSLGAAIAKDQTGKVTIRNCGFYNNASQDFGGAVYTVDTTLLQDCVFTGNSAINAGGAVYFPTGGPIAIDRCTFSNNSCSLGVIFFGDYNTSVTSNTLMAGNVTSYGVFCVQQAVPNTNVHKIINCTIADNKIYFNTQEAVKLNAASEVRNSIIWDNPGSTEVSTGLAASAVSYNIIQGGVTQANNFNLNPQFKNAAGNTANPFDVSAYNYSVKASSYAVDKGQSSFLPSYATGDVANNPRTYGNSVDMGAYEVSYCSLPAHITAGGPLSFCSGGNVTLTANSGAYSYLWSNGTTTSSVTATTAGTYVVSVSDSTCRGYDSAVVTVLSLPTPSVTNNANTLSAGTVYTTYQWKNNGTIIPGATNSTFTPSASGSYTVTVTNGNGCSGTSAPYVYTLGVEEVSFAADISVYPVPANDFVLLNTGNKIPGKIELFDVSGRNVHCNVHADVPGVYKVNLSDCPSGVYFLRLTFGEQPALKRFVISR